MLVKNIPKKSNSLGSCLYNNKLLFFALAIFTSLFIFSLNARSATPPPYITYQGRLYVGTAPASTTQNIIFTMYTAPTGGSAIYTAAGTVGAPSAISVLPTNGLFTVYLGDAGTNALDPSLFQNNSDIYLEVVVNGETLNPRKKIISTPFAFNAKYLDGVAPTSTASSSRYIPVSDATGNFNLNHVSSTGISVSGLSSLATTTISSTTIGNANVNNLISNSITTTNFNAGSFSGANASFTNLTSTNYFGTNANVTNLSSTNQFAIGLASTNFNSTNATSTNLYGSNFGALNLVAVNGTSTNFFSAGLSFTNLNGVNATTTNLSSQNISATSITSTNFFSSVLNANSLNYISATGTNLNLSGLFSFVNASGTSVTSTNVYTALLNTLNLTATNGSMSNVTTTNLNVSGVSNFGNTTITSVTSTNLNTNQFTFGSATGTNLSVSGSTNLGSTVVTNLTSTNFGFTTANGVSLTSTYIYTPGLAFQNANGTSVSSTNLFAALSAFTNANGTSLTSTNQFASLFGFTNASGTSLTTTNAYISNLMVGSCIGCGSGGSGGVVNTSTSNYFAYYLTNTGVTGTSFMTMSGNTILISGGLSATGATSITTSTITYLNATNVTTTNLTYTSATGTNLNLSGLFSFANANGASITSTNIYGTLFNAATVNGASASFTNATSTNIYTPGLAFVNANGTSLTSTNIFATLFNATTINGTNGNIANQTSTNLAVTGNTNLGNTVITNVTTTNLNVSGVTNLGATNVTSVTGTNLNISGQTNLSNTVVSNVTTTNLNVSGQTNLGSTVITSSTIAYLNNTNLTSTLVTAGNVNVTTLNGTTGTMAFVNATNITSTGGNFTNLNATTGTLAYINSTNITSTGFNGTNARFTTGTYTYINFQNATGTVLVVNNGFITTSTITYLNAQNVTSTGIINFANQNGTSITSTNISAGLTNSTLLTFTSATGTNLNLSGLFSFANANGASITSTNIYGTLFNAATVNGASASFTNATSTNIYTPGLAFVNANGTSLTSTNLFASVLKAINATTTNLTSTNAYISNLMVGSCIGCGSGGGGGAVNTSTANYFAYYLTNTGVTGTPLMVMSGNVIAISGGLNVTGDASFVTTTITTSTITSLNFGNATGTNLNVSGKTVVGNITSTNFRANGLASAQSLELTSPGLAINALTGADTYLNVGTNNQFMVDLGFAGGIAYIQGKDNVTASGVIDALILNPNGGYVGVGTSEPSTTLQVGGTFAVTGTSTLATTTISSSTIQQGNITRQISNSVTTTNLYVSGATNLGAINFSNATGTNLNLSGLFSFVNANGTSITSTNIYTPGLAFVNASGTSITSSNAFFANLVATNFNPTNLIAGSITTTNLFATTSRAINDTVTNLTFTNASGTTLTSTNIYSYGNIAIGTSTPIGRLEVYSSSTGSNMFQGKFTNTNPAGRSQFIVDSSPDFPNGALNFFALMTHGTGFSTDNYLNDGQNDAGLGILLGQGANMSKFAVGTYNGTPLSFFTSNTERLFIAANGNIGIGTTTPVTAFQVVGTSTLATTTISSSTIVYLNFTSATGTNLNLSGLFSFANANGTSITSTNIYTPGLSFINASGTSITTTNAFFNTLGVTNFNPANILATSITSTNLFATNSRFIGVSSTNIYASNRLVAAGSSTLATTTINAGNIIMNKNTPNGDTVGLYINDTNFGTSLEIAAGSAMVWIGTLNNQPLNFQTFDITRMKIWEDGTIDIYYPLTNFSDTFLASTTVSTTLRVMGTSTLATTTISSSTIQQGNITRQISNSITTTNFSYTNANGTSLTTTNLNVSGQTSLLNFTFGSATGTNLNLSGAFTFNTASGTAATFNSVTTTNLSVTNFSPANINTTNITSTNIYNSNQFIGGATSSFLGNVAIGTTSPSARLHVFDGTLLVDNPSTLTTAGTYTSTTLMNAWGYLRVVGKYAFAVSQNRNTFNILDVADPSKPTLVGTVTSSVLYRPLDIAVSGKYAYVYNGANNRVNVLDISDVSSPTIVGFVSSTNLYAFWNGSLNIAGKYLYVGTQGGITIIDISNPVAPVAKGFITGWTWPQEIKIIGKYLYTSTFGIVDVSDPNNPFVVGGINISNATGLDVSGNYAYQVQGSANGFYVINISSSSAPTTTGFTSTTVLWDGERVRVSGKYAYVLTYGGQKLVVVDISSSTAPTTTASYALGAFYTDLQIVGKYAYIIGENGDLRIIDLKGADISTANIGNIATNELTVWDDAFFGNNLYVKNALNVGLGGIKSDGGLSVLGETTIKDGGLTVDSPMHPKKIGSVSMGGLTAGTIFVSGKYAYNVAGNSLSIYNISNPKAPALEGSVTDATNIPSANYVSVVGNYAYITNFGATGGLTVVDVSNPKSPSVVAVTRSTALINSNGVYISGKYAYVISGSELSIINISNPLAPTTTAFVAGMSANEKVFVTGNYAYITGGGNVLLVVSVKDPYNPNIVGTLVDSRLDFGMGLHVVGNKAYVAANGRNGLTIVDVSNPATPSIVGFTSSTPMNGANSVFVSGKYAYMGADAPNTFDTLSVIDISSSTAPTTTGYLTDPSVYSLPGGFAVQGRYAYIASLGTHELTVIDLLGADISTANIGNLLTDQLTVTDNASFGNNLYIKNGLNVGVGGILSAGPVSIHQTNSSSQAALHVSNGTLLVDNPVNPTLVSAFDDVSSTDGLGIDVSGKYAYYTDSTGAKLFIVDISNPSYPRRVGVVTSTLLTGAADVKVSGKYAYVKSSSKNLLAVVDISNVSAPSIVGYVSSTILAGTDNIYLSGKYVYSTIGNGLAIIDISNPYSPTITGYLDDGANLGGPTDIYVSGKYAYMGDGFGNPNGGLTITDISSPYNPVFVGRTTSRSLESPWGVYVSGKYAYVASYAKNGVAIVDISNPSAPTTTGFTSSSALSQVADVSVIGKYAYVAGYGNGGIAIVDISSSTAPTITGSAVSGSAGQPTAIVVKGKYAYTIDRWNGIMGVWDIKGADISAANIGNIATNDLTVWENADIGNNLYVRNGLNVGSGGIYSNGPVSVNVDSTSADAALHVSGGTLLVDNPVHPTIVGTTSMGQASSVFVSGKYAYATNQLNDTLSIVDISNPKLPKTVGSVVIDYNPIMAYVVGKYAYVIAPTGLSIVDVSNPSSPVITGTFATTSFNGQIYVSGKYAYIEDDFGGGTGSISVVDISNPHTPILMSQFLTSGANSVYVSGKYLYFSECDSSRLSVVDISNPNSLSIVGSTPSDGRTACSASSVVSGNYAYMFDPGTGGLAIISVVNPTSPSIVGYVSSSLFNGAPGYTFRNGPPIYISGKYAYVAASSTFMVFDISSTTNPIIVGSLTNKSTLDDSKSVYVSGKYAYVAAYGANTLSVIDIGGADISTANIGNISTDALTVTENADIGNNLYVRNGLNVGVGGIMTDGGLSSFGTSTFAINPSSTVGIGTNAPKAKLHVFDGTLLVDNPVHPKIISSYSDSFTTGIGQFAVSGKYAYLSSYLRNGLVVMDVSNVNNPVRVGFTSSTSMNHAVATQVSGKYAYVMSESKNTLTVVDISNPSAPTTTGFTSSSALVNGSDIYISGKYAFVAAQTSQNLAIVDISNPYAPTTTGSVAADGVRGVYVQGKYAYLVSYNTDQLKIVNISNPYNPTIVSQTNFSYSTLSDVFVTGRFAYITVDSGYLLVVDVSNPAAPAKVSQATSTIYMNGADSVVAAGKYAYVTGRASEGLSIIDISSSTNPYFVGFVSSTATGGWWQHLQVAGKYAYVNGGWDQLSIIDIGGADIYATDIGNAAISELTVWENVDVGGNIYVRNGLNVGLGGIMTDGGLSSYGTSTFAINPSSTVGIGTNSPQAKLHVFDGTLLVDNPVRPSIMGSTIIPNGASQIRKVYISGKYAYVATDIGFNIVDVSYPSAPTTTSFLSTQALYSVFVSGKYAYVTDIGRNGLDIIDISSPTNPFLVGFTSSTNMQTGWDVYVSGKYAYVSSNSKNGLSIVDISNPFSPTTTGFTSSSRLNAATDLYVSGKYAYVAYSNGLSVVDISNPFAPTITGFIAPFLGQVESVYISGNYAYVTNYAQNGMSIINISSSTAPTTTGYIQDAINLNSAKGIYVSGKYAYITARSGSRLTVVDISSSTAPVVVGNINDVKLTGATDIKVAGKYAYVSGFSNGRLTIVDLEGADISTANIGNISTNALTVWENVDIGNNLYVRNGLNVGVGGIMSNGPVAITSSTTSTAPLLSVFGTSTMQNIIPQSNLAYNLGNTTTRWNSAWISTLNIGSSTWSLTQDPNGQLSFYDQPNGGGTKRFSLSPTGTNFIIGTTTFANLAVTGNCVGCSSLSGTGTIGTWSFSGTNVFLTTSTSNVGIGTNAPSTTMHVIGGTLTVDRPGFTTSSANILSNADGVVIQGKYAFVTDYAASQIKVIDISNPLSLRQVGFVNTTVALNKAIISGKYLYGAGQTNGTAGTYDISDPARPIEVFWQSSMSNVHEAALFGNYMFRPESGSGVAIIDQTDPQSPVEVGRLLNGVGAIQAVKVVGKYLYVTDSTTGINIYDISNPVRPVTSSIFYVNDNGRMYISGSKLYTYHGAASDSYIDIVDISSSSAPSLSASVMIKTGTNPQNITVAGKYAYVGTSAGISVVDISSSTNPYSFKFVSSTSVQELVVTGKYLYVADGAGGLRVYDLGGIDASVANIGAVSTNDLTVWENANVGNNLYVRNSIAVGVGGITSDGAVTIRGSTTSSQPALHVSNGTMLIDSPVNSKVVGFTSSTAMNGARGVAVSGKFAYVGGQTNDTFSVIDISDPANPTTTGWMDYSLGGATAGQIVSMQVVGNYAYAAAPWANELLIIDISNPKAPTTTGFISDDRIGQPWDAKVVGKYAYMTGYGNSTFSVIDVSVPKSPVLISTTTDSRLFGAVELDVAGKYAYVAANGNNALTILDISNPYLPVIVGTTTIGYGTEDVYVSGRYAYVAMDGGFAVVDVSNPLAPTTTGKILDGSFNWARDITVSGKYAYVASALNDYMNIVDISNPVNPVLISNVTIPGTWSQPNSVAVAGKYAYVVSDQQNGLAIVDIGGADISNANIGNVATNDLTVWEDAKIGNNLSVGNSLTVGKGGIKSDGIISAQNLSISDGLLSVNSPANPEIVGFTSSTKLKNGWSTYVSGKYAYVAGYPTGFGYLAVLDVSNPAAPTTTGYVSSTSLDGMSSLAVAGKYAYSTGYYSPNLAIFDISNPSAPTTTSLLNNNLFLNSHSVAVSGKYLYVSSESRNSLAVVDITNPRAPTTTGFTSSTNLSGARQIYINGKYAYVTSLNKNGFSIIDISNPRAPTTTGFTSSSAMNTATDVYVSGKYAYVASYFGGFSIVDVSSSTAPTTTGRLTSILGLQKIFVSGKYAYITDDFNNRLVVVDVSSTTNPVYVGAVSSNTKLAQATGLFVSGRYAYVSTNDANNGGLAVIDIKGADISTANIGNMSSNDLTIYENVDIGNSLFVRNSLNVGMGGIYTNGEFTAYSTSTLFGNVIIGTTTYFANAKLVVDAGTSSAYGLAINGYARASGGFFASTSLDLAERYPIDPACEANGTCPMAGDVICQIENTSTIAVEKCSVPYSPLALGIVSTDPGFVLEGGYTDVDSRKIALAGRVPVRVSTANGNIKPGDLLAPSSIPGIAVKATEPGTTVGKALESYTDSTVNGFITAFVQLGWNNSLNMAISGSSTSPSSTASVTFVEDVIKALKQFGIIIEQGILRVQNFFADKVTTNELCVGNTCVNETQLIELLNKNNLTSTSTINVVPTPPSPPVDNGAPSSTASTTVPVVDPAPPTTTPTVDVPTTTPPADPAPVTPPIDPAPVVPPVDPTPVTPQADPAPTTP